MSKMIGTAGIAGIALALAITSSTVAADMARPMPATAQVEAVFGVDDRVELSLPFVVRLLDERGRFVCSGSVIGEGGRTVLSSAHCTGYERSRGFPWSKRSIRWVETADGTRVRVTKSCVSPEYGGVDDDGLLHLTDVTPDVALVRTEKRIPAPAVAVYRGLSDGDRVLLAGYHGDKPRELQGTICRANRFGSVFVFDRVEHRCDSVAGASGSPLLVKRGGSYRLVGVHSSTAVDGTTSYASLMGGEKAVDRFIAEGLAGDPDPSFSRHVDRRL